uniref:Zinc finger protein jing homolog n=2 Tax=Culex pipiens TaxID=7175 RepID=A0A8D8IJH8_CULPI
MNGAVIKLHQLQQQQQQLATSSGQPVTTTQQTLAMEAAVNMSLNGLLAKQAISNPPQAHTGKATYALQTQPAQLFQQASAAQTAFAPQQLIMTPAGGFLLNAASLPTMLNAASLQQALAQANIPALHPLQPSQPQPPTQQLPNITAILQQQQQQQAQSNFHQLLANIPQALLQNLQATAKLGQGPQFVPISSHLFLNQSAAPPTFTTSPITISTSTLPSGSTTMAQPLSPPPLVATVPTYSTTSKPIMNTLSSQKIIIGTAPPTAKPPPPIKPISSSEPPKLVPVQLNKPSISITPVMSTNPPKLVPPASTVPVPKLVLSASVAAKATSTKPNLPVPALAPASHHPQPIPSPRIIDNKSPPALNPLTLDCCGSSNDSGIVANSSDSEDKSLTIDLCSPGTPDSGSPQKKDDDSSQKAPSSPSPPPTPETEPASPSTEEQPPSPPTPPPAPEPALPPLLPLVSTVEKPLPPSQTSPKSLVLELIKSKLDEEPPQESMSASSDQDSTNLNSPLDDQQPPSSSGSAPSESQRSTTPIELQSPPSIETDFLNVPPMPDCAKSPILSQPKTIRFPALNGAHHKFGRKGFRRLSDGRLFGVCYWSECNAQFDTSWHLQDHLQIQHVNSQSGPFVCLWDGCKVYNKESCSRKWLDRHVQSHGGTKSHKCIVPGCGMRFGSQLALEKHVNNHFTNSDNAASGKRSSDLPLPKVLRKTGKKLRFRRQPWSARRFDFFDIGVMEGLQHRLILAGSVASARYGTVSFQGQAAGRRVTGDGTVEVFVKWHPRDVISDDWIPEAEVSLTKDVSIAELNPDQRFELESQLSTNRKANAELLSCISELNAKLAAIAAQQDSTPCSSGSSSASSSSGCCSGSSSSISTPIPFNSRTSPKKFRKPPKEPASATPTPTLSSGLSSSASSLLSSGCGSSSSSSSSSASSTTS